MSWELNFNPKSLFDRKIVYFSKVSLFKLLISTLSQLTFMSQGVNPWEFFIAYLALYLIKKSTILFELRYFALCKGVFPICYNPNWLRIQQQSWLIRIRMRAYILGVDIGTQVYKELGSFDEVNSNAEMKKRIPFLIFPPKEIKSDEPLKVFFHLYLIYLYLIHTLIRLFWLIA